MAIWNDVRNLLCVRLDNMGDLLMSGPAITALKQTFSCSITVLTSSAAAPVARHMPAVDEVMIWNVPWMKLNGSTNHSTWDLVAALQNRKFDAAIIFTVFSQNP